MVGWRDGGLAAALAASIAASGVVGEAAAQARPERAIRCGGDVLARAGAGRVIDGRTFVLADGREVRLAAIEVPPLPLPKPEPEPQQTDAARGGAAAKDALAALLSGADVVVRRADVASDRYGRLLGFASAVRDGVEKPAQAELLASGFARVAAHVGARDCATELLARERAARAGKLGLWADSTYNLLAADNPAGVLAQRDRFALVEGTVISVRESGATIYVNFGRRWTEDFTVTIHKRNERKFVAAGLEPKRLAGRVVRVRGWIEERGGPWIEAVYPEQIELTDRE
jgi:endonuclease YncB( thermonuclease family)